MTEATMTEEFTQALVDRFENAPAAWTTVDEPDAYRGITYLECTVTNEAGDVVSKSLITYKLSRS